MDEMEKVSNAIRVLYNPIKVNVGALGNVVRQLHIHIVGRTECDPAWPGRYGGTARQKPTRRRRRDASAGGTGKLGFLSA